jgi:hypothetical protein
MNSENNGNERKILYAITNGEYSDYGICALTSDYERAKVLAKYYTRNGNEAQIEKFIDGDPESPETNELQNLRPVWNVRGYADKHGIKWKAWMDRYELKSFENKYKCFLYQCVEGSNIFDGLIMAEDEEHALKIAQDQYAKMKAERLGL